MRPVRIALALRGRQFIRSWLESGLVFHLRKAGIEVVVFADSETRGAMLAEERIGVVPLTEQPNDWISTHQRRLSAIEMRKKSSTRRFGLQRKLLSDYWMIPRTGTPIERVIGGLKGIGRVIRSVRRNYWELIYTVPLTRSFMKAVFSLRSSSVNDESIVFRGFDWIVVPSAGIGTESDLLAAASQSGTRSLVVIDNWDHLTAKGTFTVKPDFLSVMGLLDISYAAELHDIEKHRVLEFGLPRFDIYRDGRYSFSNIEGTRKPRIIYLGWSLPHSEERIVSYLYRHLESELGDDYFQFVYRPHPRRAIVKDRFRLTTENITIHSFGEELRTDMPRMDEEFVRELTIADVVVGPPTTMMLEAAILGRPCVLDLTTDDFHRTSAGHMSQKCLHLQDLIRVPTIDKAYSKSELVTLTESKVRYRTEEIHHDIRHLYNRDERCFRDLLTDFLMHC